MQDIIEFENVTSPVFIIYVSVNIDNPLVLILTTSSVIIENSLSVSISIFPNAKQVIIKNDFIETSSIPYGLFNKQKLMGGGQICPP